MFVYKIIVVILVGIVAYEVYTSFKNYIDAPVFMTSTFEDQATFDIPDITTCMENQNEANVSYFHEKWLLQTYFYVRLFEFNKRVQAFNIK